MAVVQPNSHLSASMMVWKRFKDFGGRRFVISQPGLLLFGGRRIVISGQTDCATLTTAGLFAVHYDTVKSSALMDGALQCRVV